MKNQNWLRDLRKQQNMSQEDLAAKLQLGGFTYTRGSINNWENEYNAPPLHNPDFRIALAKALRINVRRLLKLAGYEVDELPHGDIAEQVAELVDQLPADKQELALRLVEQIARTG